MPSSRKLHFLSHAALAMCAGAVLIWANRTGSNQAVRQSVGLPAGSMVATAGQTADLRSLSDVATADNHGFGVTHSVAARVSVPVAQILPQLGQPVADWRGYRPQKLVIAPHADLPMEFEMTATREENGRTIWHGRNALTGAFLVTVATENDWHAVLDLPASGSFEFHITGQTAFVAEKNEPVRCGESPVMAEADLAGEIAELAAASGPATDDDESLLKTSTVDVLFFYDAATFAANDRSKAAIEASIAARVEAANLVLENSRVKNFRWRYIAAYLVPEYTATGKLADDLGAITFTDNQPGQFVLDKCALHGVDQAMIFVSGARDYAGLAWVPAGGDSVAHHAAAKWDSSYTVMAHELAHNFGCRHDRRSENVADDDGRTAYGFRFEYRGEDTGTVMSYAPNRVPYFSNPEVSFNGIPLGVANGQPGAANNSRLLQDKAGLMVSHRDACQKPIITDQPAGTTVFRGSGLTLKVGVVGDGLTFQWRKNSVVIAGATSSTFAKSPVGDDDAGTYEVKITNDSGEAASVAVAVTVASPAADTNGQTAAGSQGQTAGGGGGGAPGDWFFAALILLGAVRLVSQRGSRACR